MNPASPQRIVIIGGGQGAGASLRHLRALAYGGITSVVCAEDQYPYERPPLSKDYLNGTTTLDALTLCKPENPREQFYLADTAERIDPAEKVVALRSGVSIPYDKLLIATGGEARKLVIAGADFPNVHYLRTVHDARRLRTALAACRAAQTLVLVIGGGWIGLEIAAAARQAGLATTLIEAAPQLCGRSLPAPVAAELLRAHQDRGVNIRLGCAIHALHGDDRATAATLSDGSTVPVGMVVVGIGLIPNTQLAADAALAVGNGIRVDVNGRTSDPHIYAVGDVAEFPCTWHGCAVRMETWNNANVQAARAISAMLQHAESPPAGDAVPWFWSDQFDLNLQVLGAPLAGDGSLVSTDAEGGALHLYIKSTRLIGAIGINRARDIRILKRAVERDPQLPFERVANCLANLRELL
ncbi:MULTISPECIES: FAD-dependent oxidoreductase [unclassified Cupriavidus]|uniref:NAD(P)/FAD-dependent oxidoreductase n=1 Tax=unclassified Cupriavidus TaxID=2640874 RepID=UPI00041ACDAC|nr:MULTISPECIES: FAD-dependent oxidoreductase [unclassified Cupriavidus]MBP0633156.1 FAD-dependent oxidoreductase [Cupriavidus sp. AcVe19-1a]